MMIEPGAAAVLFAGAFLGALVSSFAGFAFAPVAGVLLVTSFAPTTLVPVLMLCSVIVQAVTLIRLRHALAPSRIGALLAGGALGVPLAVALLQRIEPRPFQIGFGLFLVAYALLMLRRPSACLRAGARSGREAAVGFLGGVVGGLTAMPGAIPVLYCDMRGVGKEAQRATVQPFILAMQLLAVALLAASGAVTLAVLGLVLMALPALAAGIVLGLALFGRVPDAGFRRVVLILLLATGAGTALRQAGPLSAPPATPLIRAGAL
jgi:uncharacterized membrane protein YfcA